MRTGALIERLSANLAVIRGLVDVGDEQARWKPSTGGWCILEVINHLYDEEREDFRARIRLLFEDPSKEWPGIDPEGWVGSREYMKRDLAASLEGFEKERRDSMAWLEGLAGEADWEVFKTHPVAGKLSAGDLFASWVAHDFLHIRQLNRLHYEYAAHLAGPYSPAYAGRW